MVVCISYQSTWIVINVTPFRIFLSSLALTYKSPSAHVSTQLRSTISSMSVMLGVRVCADLCA